MSLADFYKAIRPMFGDRLSQPQVDGIEVLLDTTLGLPITHRAYLLATTMHETDRTMQPIAEYGKGRGKPYGKPGKHFGQAPYGRGYVQLTWDANYEKADRALGLNGALLRDFNLAMKPDIAAKILVLGCEEGWFTGKKLGDYLPADYINARRVVNGIDKAKLIAGYAEKFEGALVALASKPVDDIPAPNPSTKPAVNKGDSAPSWLSRVFAAIASLFKRKLP